VSDRLRDALSRSSGHRVSPSSAASCGMLQTRVGKETPPLRAALTDRRPASRQQLIHDGTRRSKRAPVRQLARLMFPQFDKSATSACSPRVGPHTGRGRGAAVFDSASAVARRPASRGDPGAGGDQSRRPQRHDRGRRGLTSRGRETSPAAVVARDGAQLRCAGGRGPSMSTPNPAPHASATYRERGRRKAIDGTTVERCSSAT